MIRIVKLNKLFNYQIATGQVAKLLPSCKRFSTNASSDVNNEISDVHFRASGRPHPLIGNKSIPQVTLGDHSGS